MGYCDKYNGDFGYSKCAFELSGLVFAHKIVLQIITPWYLTFNSCKAINIPYVYVCVINVYTG